MKSKPKPNVLVAMPAFNEAKYIGSLILKAKEYGDKIIVIDDGSKDNTAEIAKLAGATVIKHEENRGYGAAIQSIIKEAKKTTHDVLVILDADSQHNPEDIPFLVQGILSGSDIVIGSRKLQRSKIPRYRRVGQQILLRITSILSREKLSDTESGFRAFSRKAVNELDLDENGMAVSAETVAAAARNRLKIVEVPISVEYTKDGSTLNPWRHGLSVLGRILYMISERRPLLFFGLAGLAIIVIGFVFGLRVFYVYSVGGVLPVGTALMSVLFLIIGILSMFTGIILNALLKVKR